MAETSSTTPDSAANPASAPQRPEKLCVFCVHFRWASEEMWGMGSTMTGPMFTGGDANCTKGHGAAWQRPHDEADFRQIIVTAAACADYRQVVS